MVYYLATYDTKKDYSWRVLHNKFIISKNTDDKICGLFLKDIWYTYGIEEKTSEDIHFMLLYSGKTHEEIRNELLNNKLQSSHTNTLYFVLKKDLIEKTVNLLKKHGDTENINLYDSINNMLSFDVMLCKEKYYLTLPKFCVKKQY